MQHKKINLDVLSEKERGYLFGLFFGDGYKIYDKKSRHYHVEFYLNSERDTEIIDYLITLLIKINLKPGIYQDKRYNCKRVRVYSKSLFSQITKNITLLNFSKDFQLGYISGVIDSEGYVNKKKYTLLIVNTKKRTLEKIGKCLQKQGIGYSLRKRTKCKKDKQDSYRMLISVNFKKLCHLSIKAGKL